MPIWLQWLLGGRPMVQIEESFRDKVSHKMVYHFLDCRGRMWLANTRWSFFRQRMGADWEEEKARRAAEQAMVETEGRSGSFYNLGRDS